MSFSIMCSFIVALAISAHTGMAVGADMADKMIWWVGKGKFFTKSMHWCISSLVVELNKSRTNKPGNNPHVIPMSRKFPPKF